MCISQKSDRFVQYLKIHVDFSYHVGYNQYRVKKGAFAQMRSTAVRSEKLLSMINQKKKLSVKEIAAFFDLSEPTARRLCAKLANDGKILRTYGGISCLPQREEDYQFDTLENQFIDEKRRIGEYASTLFHDNDIIFLEAGTTVQQLAVSIANRFINGSLTNLLVFTNSLINLNILAPYCNVTLIGGMYRPTRKDCAGYISERTVRGLRFTRSFMGTDGIDVEDGIMAMDVETARIDELLVTRSEHVYVLTDSSKFTRTSLISYASAQDISMIVTDTNLSEVIRNSFAASGITLICV